MVPPIPPKRPLYFETFGERYIQMSEGEQRLIALLTQAQKGPTSRQANDLAQWVEVIQRSLLSPARQEQAARLIEGGWVPSSGEPTDLRNWFKAVRLGSFDTVVPLATPEAPQGAPPAESRPAAAAAKRVAPTQASKSSPTGRAWKTAVDNAAAEKARQSTEPPGNSKTATPFDKADLSHPKKGSLIRTTPVWGDPPTGKPKPAVPTTTWTPHQTGNGAGFGNGRNGSADGSHAPATNGSAKPHASQGAARAVELTSAERHMLSVMEKDLAGEVTRVVDGLVADGTVTAANAEGLKKAAAERAGRELWDTARVAKQTASSGLGNLEQIGDSAARWVTRTSIAELYATQVPAATPLAPAATHAASTANDAAASAAHAPPASAPPEPAAALESHGIIAVSEASPAATASPAPPPQPPPTSVASAPSAAPAAGAHPESVRGLPAPTSAALPPASSSVTPSGRAPASAATAPATKPVPPAAAHPAPSAPPAPASGIKLSQASRALIQTTERELLQTAQTEIAEAIAPHKLSADRANDVVTTVTEAVKKSLRQQLAGKAKTLAATHGPDLTAHVSELLDDGVSSVISKKSIGRLCEQEIARVAAQASVASSSAAAREAPAAVAETEAVTLSPKQSGFVDAALKRAKPALDEAIAGLVRDGDVVASEAKELKEAFSARIRPSLEKTVVTLTGLSDDEVLAILGDDAKSLVDTNRLMTLYHQPVVGAATSSPVASATKPVVAVEPVSAPTPPVATAVESPIKGLPLPTAVLSQPPAATAPLASPAPGPVSPPPVVAYDALVKHRASVLEVLRGRGTLSDLPDKMRAAVDAYKQSAEGKAWLAIYRDTYRSSFSCLDMDSSRAADVALRRLDDAALQAISGSSTPTPATPAASAPIKPMGVARSRPVSVPLRSDTPPDFPAPPRPGAAPIPEPTPSPSIPSGAPKASVPHLAHDGIAPGSGQPVVTGGNEAPKWIAEPAKAPAGNGIKPPTPAEAWFPERTRANDYLKLVSSSPEPVVASATPVTEPPPSTETTVTGGAASSPRRGVAEKLTNASDELWKLGRGTLTKVSSANIPGISQAAGLADKVAATVENTSWARNVAQSPTAHWVSTHTAPAVRAVAPTVARVGHVVAPVVRAVAGSAVVRTVAGSAVVKKVIGPVLKPVLGAAMPAIGGLVIASDTKHAWDEGAALPGKLIRAVPQAVWSTVQMSRAAGGTFMIARGIDEIVDAVSPATWSKHNVLGTFNLGIRVQGVMSDVEVGVVAAIVSDLPKTGVKAIDERVDRHLKPLARKHATVDAKATQSIERDVAKGQYGILAKGVHRVGKAIVNAPETVRDTARTAKKAAVETGDRLVQAVTGRTTDQLVTSATQTAKELRSAAASKAQQLAGTVKARVSSWVAMPSLKAFFGSKQP